MHMHELSVSNRHAIKMCMAYIELAQTEIDRG
jgi:hypothetical protein